MPATLHRRQFMSLAAGSAAATTSPSLWAGGLAQASPSLDPPRLVVVFLRGAVDGLSVVMPYDDPHYQRARPSIRIARPGVDGGALDLDGHFGVHPALASLLPLWQAGRLGFVHAAGSPDPTRSHFDAQNDLETGTPGRRATPDGWMNRLLGSLPLPTGTAVAAPTRAVSIGPVLPRIVAGPQHVANIAAGAAATRPLALDRANVSQAFDAMYAGPAVAAGESTASVGAPGSAGDPLARAYQEARQQRQDIMGAMNSTAAAAEMRAADNGAPGTGGFAADATRMATLMRNDPRMQLGFMAVGGWDTHANQGNADGALARRLGQLGQGLAALAQHLGPVLEHSVVVVMSEFGRTVRENGNRGTDHGHGNLMWLLGGPIAGGRVHGAWPGLGDAALYEGRDLAVTTDFRTVLAELAQRHLRLPDAQLAGVFPGYQMPRGDAALKLISTTPTR